MFHGNELGLDPAAVTWPRTMDMNDRALRNVVVQVTGPDRKLRDGALPVRQGQNRASGFLITAASEMMAILSLAEGREDLRARLTRIVVGANKEGKPVTAGALGAVGPMMALLNEALEPNLVQTTEGTPALVHCGPFANIAHGTSSVVSQKMGLRLADYAVNETGFASDLGFEKYMDLVSPASGIKPACAVLVTTVQSVRNQGEGELTEGFRNLEKHIAIVKGFGLPAVVAINRFPKDTEEELGTLRSFCEARGAAFALSEAFAKGGEGATELARKVVEVIEGNPVPALTTTYDPGDSAEEKIAKVARGIYGADGVEFSERAMERLRQFEAWGFGGLPVCIAKTQYSLSHDPDLKGAPTGFTVPIRDVRLAVGAGYL